MTLSTCNSQHSKGLFSLKLFLSTNSYVAVINAFRNEFPMRRPSHIKLILKFHRLGTVYNQNAGYSGRLRTARTPESIDRVQQALAKNPCLSSRRNDLELSQTTFNEITRIDLAYHPYRMRIRHALENRNRQRRIDYSNLLIEQFRDENFLNKIVIVDEAAFSMLIHIPQCCLIRSKE